MNDVPDPVFQYRAYEIISDPPLSNPVIKGISTVILVFVHPDSNLRGPTVGARGLTSTVAPAVF